jgi:sorting nexin-29
MKRVLSIREVTWIGKSNFGTSKCRVQMQNNLSEPFGTLMGLRMGGTLLCILLNIALEKVVKGSDRETKGTVCNKTIQIYVYADDIVSVKRPTGVLKEAIMNLRKAAKEMGLNLAKN